MNVVSWLTTYIEPKTIALDCIADIHTPYQKNVFY